MLYKQHVHLQRRLFPSNGKSFVMKRLFLSSILGANSTNDSSIAALVHRYLDDQHP
jgi:hypothetical protein